MIIGHRRRRFAVLLAVLIAAGLAAVPAVSTAQPAASSGEAVYSRHCASCHDQVSARIPTREALDEDVAGAHPAHARLRADDEHRLSDAARRTRGGGDLSRHRCRRRRACRRARSAGRTVRSPPVRARELDGLESLDTANTRFQPAETAGPDRRGHPRARAEVGVRLSRRRDRVRGTDRRERHAVRRQRRRAPCRRSTRRPAACTGCTRRAVRCAPR